MQEPENRIEIGYPGSLPDYWMNRLPFYYGWLQMITAALAMVGTLPERTQGLGLVIFLLGAGALFVPLPPALHTGVPSNGKEE